MILSSLRNKVNSLLLQRTLAVRKVKEEKSLLSEAREQLLAAEEARKIVQEVSQSIQQAAQRQIASVVTRCLKTVFGKDEGYEFSIILEQKRGKTEARLVFLREGQEIDPTESSGGGCIDIAAFALRLSCLILSRPQRRKLLVLDEPFRFLSSNYHERVKELLETLADEMKCQFVIVTHSEGLLTGKVIRL